MSQVNPNTLLGRDLGTAQDMVKQCFDGISGEQTLKS